ncbi:MAG: hypothetical protein IKH54_06100 [Bacilli bacterium]|nr:hypothetical protein [Bacilli bacterium]
MKKLFKKKKDFEELEEYDEYSYDEPEIIESHSIEELEEYKNKKNKKYKLYKRIINIFFIIIVLLLIMITVDVIAVSKYNVGPFFAINTKTYKDGGTKEYLGLGYKVIKYNQEQGRRDYEIGNYKLKYDSEPLDVTDIDLAIEFENNYEKTNKKYYKEFIRFSSTVKKVDSVNNKLILEYLDEDSKYTLTIYCSMADKNSYINVFSEGDTANVIGTVKTFKVKDGKKSNRLYLINCFAESAANAEIVEIED